MRAFYKIVDNDGFITGFGTNGNDATVEIEEGEHENLVTLFKNVPTAPDGFAYILRDNPREWVLVEVEPDPEPDLDDSEALAILLGGAT